ncbi:hypothetical protein JCM12141A_50540 [Mycolicibacterium hodleri]
MTGATRTPAGRTSGTSPHLANTSSTGSPAASAAIRSTRDCGGGSVDATTAPASTSIRPGPYPTVTRAPGTRLEMTIATPAARARRTPSITAAPAFPDPSDSSTTPRAPAATHASSATASLPA